MVKAADLIRLWRQALDDGWGYIWGAYGQLWTAAKQKAATRDTTVRYGSQWIGHRVSDCSGLAYWAFREQGGTMYHGSNTIWNQYVVDRCELKEGKRTDGEPMLPGDPVFLVRTENGQKNRHHIGYWVGDTVIESKSTRYGVVTSPLTHWHETAHWGNVEYKGGKVFVIHPTLKKGDTGDAVTYLQTLLGDVGETLTADGKFGTKTEKAVMDFQRLYGLTVDGVVGPATWDALEKATSHSDDETENPEQPETIAISREDWDTICRIVKKYENVG